MRHWGCAVSCSRGLNWVLDPNRENAELQRERKTDDMTHSLWKLADSAEEAGTMVTGRDCFSKGKKGKYRDFPRVET